MGSVSLTTKPESVPPAKTRRQRNREETIATILAAARAIMREEGAAALNLNEVARRVGMRTPSLYEYFDGKMALYDALYLQGIRLFGERLQSIAERQLPFWERLYAETEAYMAFAQEHPDLYQLVFERPVPRFAPSAASMAESQQLLTEGVQSFVEELQRAGIAPHLSSEQAFDLIIAVTHGLTAQHMANEPHLPVGTGRFGSLIPAAVELFRAAWENEQSK
jgi:AcrR family transcriptional regulator